MSTTPPDRPGGRLRPSPPPAYEERPVPPGGDPDSIDFFHNSGLDYVSCSPFRVPVARVAAAQAAIRRGDDGGW